MTPVRMTPTTLSLAPLLTMARSPPVMLKCWPVFSSVRIRQLGSTPSSTVPTTVRRSPAATDGTGSRLGVPAGADANVEPLGGGSRTAVGLEAPVVGADGSVGVDAALDPLPGAGGVGG